MQLYTYVLSFKVNALLWRPPNDSQHVQAEIIHGNCARLEHAGQIALWKLSKRAEQAETVKAGHGRELLYVLFTRLQIQYKIRHHHFWFIAFSIRGGLGAWKKNLQLHQSLTYSCCCTLLYLI